MAVAPSGEYQSSLYPLIKWERLEEVVNADIERSCNMRIYDESEWTPKGTKTNSEVLICKKDMQKTNVEREDWTRWRMETRWDAHVHISRGKRLKKTKYCTFTTIKRHL